MGSRLVRSLVFACSLLLTLPQGWCCIFACHTAKATSSMSGTTEAGKDVPGDAGGGCPLCMKHSEPSSGSSDWPTPTDKPSAPCQSVCPCADRHATLPASALAEQMDMGFALFLPPLDAATSIGGQRAAVDGMDFFPPSLRLHILKCVWLC